MKTRDELIEIMARAMCKDMGMEPDAVNGQGDPTEPRLWQSWPQWKEFESSAIVCLDALLAELPPIWDEYGNNAAYKELLAMKKPE